MNKKRKTISGAVFEGVQYIFAALFIAMFLQSQVLAMSVVNQQSMENTFLAGEKLVVEKISYGMQEPERGDIIVFLNDETWGETNTKGLKNRLKIYFNDLSLRLDGKYREDRLIKRVIAVGGDEIVIKEGYVYLNGEKLEEPYTKTSTYAQNISVIVPEGYVYVLGDNRERSIDSRVFGSIEIEHIEGRVIFRLLPLKRMGNPNVSYMVK